MGVPRHRAIGCHELFRAFIETPAHESWLNIATRVPIAWTNAEVIPANSEIPPGKNSNERFPVYGDFFVGIGGDRDHPRIQQIDPPAAALATPADFCFIPVLRRDDPGTITPTARRAMAIAPG